MTEFDYNKIPIGYYDNVLEIGLENKKGLQSCWHHLKFLSVKKEMGEYKNHLDIACGPGTFIGKYLDNKSTGWDISEQQIDYAKSKYPFMSQNFVVKDLRDAINSDEKYDVITLLEFIEHISSSEVKTIVNELFNMLNDGGKIIITTPNYRGLWLFIEKIVSLLGPVNYKDQHINRYTVRKVQKEFNMYNLKIKKYINFGIFSSFISHNLGLKFNKIISEKLNSYFGYSLIISINKPVTC